MDLFFSPYELQRTDKVETQKGCLLKISNADVWGVADIGPRLELGDIDYISEIKQKGSLYKRALFLAGEDLEARKNQVSLLNDQIITNNFLVTNYKQFNFSDSRLNGQTIKIKGDEEIVDLANILNQIKSKINIRLDFNAKLNVAKFQFFLDQLTPEAIARIEYIEDPTQLSEAWMRWNKKVPLAYDFQESEYVSEFARYQIIKPSREALPTVPLHNYTLTSAMDHPVGLAHGLRLAQAYLKTQINPKVSGFLTLNLYEDIGFNKYFYQKDNLLNFSQLALDDVGIGMTKKIDSLSWIKLEELLK